MAKFTVDIKEVWSHTIEVELPANATKEQILEAAQKRLAEGDEGETEYSHTLDSDQWTVWDDQGSHL